MCLPRLREVWLQPPGHSEPGGRSRFGGHRLLRYGFPRIDRGDWRSGSALRSHRRGHWFEPSIAHPFRAPARRRSGSAALPFAPKRSLVRTQYRPPERHRRRSGSAALPLHRRGHWFDPVSPTRHAARGDETPRPPAACLAFHQARRGQQLACTAMEPSPPGWYRDPKAPGAGATGTATPGSTWTASWTAIPSRDRCRPGCGSSPSGVPSTRSRPRPRPADEVDTESLPD